MLLEAGQKVDRYDVEALLGEGGMAEVYRVRHRTLGSLHALKVLKLEISGLKERLVQEGQVQATLRHANVVAVTDVVEIAGKPGLVMEFIAGPTLELWLRNHQPTLEEAEALFLGILAGVARAHRIGLVHRDLKPGNVLLEETDDGVIPKVADFGLAKVLVEQGGAYRTRSGVPMGTPAYMAPEQVRDAANVDQRADIFALGAILYELVTGLPPFDAPDALSIFARLARGEYVPPEELVPTLPERFRRAIRGALRIEREDRIPDCASLRALLSGGQEVSDVSVAHVVALRGARPRATVVNTLEPAGHGRPSGSDTFAAEGVAGVPSPPTMAPASIDLADGPASAAAEPAPIVAERGVATAPAVRPSGGPRVSGAGSWLLGLGALGMLGLAGGGLAPIGFGLSLTAPVPKPTPPPPQIPEAPAPPRVEVAGGDAPAGTLGAEPPVPLVPASEGPPRVAAPKPAPESPSASPPATPPPGAPTAGSTPSASAGSLLVTGDADEVWLERAGARVAPTALDAGDYQLHARFGTVIVASGTVRVRAGGSLTVHCSAAFKLCRARAE